MLESLLAGLEESPGQTIIFEGRKFKSYRGMGSIEAMQSGSSDRYFQDHKKDNSKLVPEGIVGRVPYKGKLSESIFQYIGGLRAGMGYSGSKNINDLKSAKFIKISSASMKESHPHNVTITREAPNYSHKTIIMKQFLLIFLFTFSFLFSQDKHLMKIGDNLFFQMSF